MATGISPHLTYQEVFGKSVKDKLMASNDGKPIIVSWEGTSDEFFHVLRTYVGLPVYIGEIRRRSATIYDFLLKLDTERQFSTALYELEHS
jgi:hypothetical protein